VAALTPCHPERSEWFAKRSIHAVEGPRIATLGRTYQGILMTRIESRLKVPSGMPIIGTNPSGSSDHARQHSENSLTSPALTYAGKGCFDSVGCFALRTIPLRSA
jgi:hypothetical protein